MIASFNCIFAVVWLLLFCVSSYGAVVWSAVCECGNSWLYSLDFSNIIQKLPVF